MKTRSNRKILIIIFVILLLVGILYLTFSQIQSKKSEELPIVKIQNAATALHDKYTIPMSYHDNIIKEAEENTNFRQVLFTGENSQLVVMSIPPGGEVGEETHKYTEQTLFFLRGTGEGMLDDKKFPINAGDVVVVVPGTKHNFWNIGTSDLKIYTVYTPPNHIDGRTHITKADADADIADEQAGEIPPVK